MGPDDVVLLRAGDRFPGMLHLNARGAEGQPLVVSSFGEGTAVIDGAGQEAAIRLVNPSHIAIRHLELVNSTGSYGIYLTAQDAGALGPVILEALEIHDVYRSAWQAVANAAHDEKKYFGAINARVLRGEEPSWWTGLVIRNCRIHNVGTCGISVGSDYPLHLTRRTRRNFEPFPILGVRLEGNTIHDVARDGAIIRQCRGATLQYNDVARTGLVSVSNGLWFWDCEDCALRFNVGYECGAREGVDGAPFSIDYFCQDCSIESNYSHDNEGPGVMAFGNQGTGQGTIIRGNVSYNDATSSALRSGFAAVSMVSTISDATVAENVVIAGPGTQRLLGHHDWQGRPIAVVYRGNVFVGNGRAPVEPSVVDAGRFDGNLFIDVPNLPAEIEAQTNESGRAFAAALAKLRRVQQRDDRR